MNDLRQEQIRLEIQLADEEASLLIWQLVEQEYNNIDSAIFNGYDEPRALHAWMSEYCERGYEALPIWPFLDPYDYELAHDYVTITHVLQLASRI